MRQSASKEQEICVQKFADLLKRVESFSMKTLSQFYLVTHIPCQFGHQMKRNNVSQPEEYFRISVFLLCLDTFISGITDHKRKSRGILKGFDILHCEFVENNGDFGY